MLPCPLASSIWLVSSSSSPLLSLFRELEHYNKKIIPHHSSLRREAHNTHREHHPDARLKLSNTQPGACSADVATYGGSSEIYDRNVEAVEDKPNFSDDLKNLRSATSSDVRTELTKLTRTLEKNALKDLTNINARHLNTLRGSLQSSNTNFQRRGNRNVQRARLTKPCKYGDDVEKEGKYFNRNDDANEGDELDELDTLESLCSSDAKDNENFLGTNLFGNVRKRCFTLEEVALLSARRDFENLIPKEFPESLLSDRFVTILMKYFYGIHEMISGMSNEESKGVAQRAFYDTLGGYLNYYLVPVSKYSFYAGQVSLQTVENVILLHRNCKKYLNVNGNGWKPPIKDVLRKLKSVHIEPLHMDKAKGCSEATFCLHLDMNSDQIDSDKGKMIVPLPNLEPEDHNNFLNNIFLPFKRKQTYDLRSGSSAYVLVKFYETVYKCYQYERIDQKYFNNKFRNWLLENVYVHMNDEQFYPGLGAVLRIYEILKRDKKHVRHDEQFASETDQDFDYKGADVYSEGDNESYMMESNNHVLIGGSKYIQSESSTPLVNGVAQKIADISQAIKAKIVNDNPEQPALSNSNEYLRFNLVNQDNVKKNERDVNKMENAMADLVENATANVNLFQRMANEISNLTQINQKTNSRGIFDFTRSDTLLVWLLLLIFAAIPIFAIYSVVDGKKSKGKHVRLSVESKKSRRRAGNETKDATISQVENLISKQPEEEEILLQSDSKSVLPATVRSAIRRPSETLNQLSTEAKKLKFHPVIDTTSLDYTSSEAEEKLTENFQKLPTKSVSIDEKTVHLKSSKSSFDFGLLKSKTSMTSSDKNKKEKNKKSVSKHNVQNKKSKNSKSSSWETDYSSK
uniref:Uncharacterized protein n=1 Tax=Glossina brevipalpis TaxID=37001 RepID=A0A1A9W7Y3_9MUSC